MDPVAHAALMFSAAVFVTAAGIVALALAWRRAYRHEPSGVVLGGLSTRRAVVSVVRIPLAGLLMLVALGALAPLLR